MAIDLWVNAMPRRTYMPDASQARDSPHERIDTILASMDSAGVDLSVLVTRLGASSGHRDILSVEELLEVTTSSRQRLVVSAYVDRPDSPTRQAMRIRQLAGDPAFAMVRVMPVITQTAIDSPVFYAIYASCEELGLPVSITVGAGPKGSGWACQNPERLEPVLTDFPHLKVIADHVGRPFEPYLAALARAWPNLYLSNSAHRADRLHAEVLDLMARLPGKVVFGSDHPLLAMSDAIASARSLALSPEQMNAYLNSARGLLERTPIQA